MLARNGLEEEVIFESLFTDRNEMKISPSAKLRPDKSGSSAGVVYLASSNHSIIQSL